VSGVAVHQLSCRYPERDREALAGISLTVPRGALAVVMGATGAGKSTLARCLTRLVPAFLPATVRGEIPHGGGRDRFTVEPDLAGRIGLVFQDFEAQLFSTDVMQEMTFALEHTGVAVGEMGARVEAALRAVGLVGFERRDPTTLSGGEKQRLAIAGLLALRPGIMVFDEPTTDLDPRGRADVFRVLHTLCDEGLAVVVIEHDPAVAVGADLLVVLQEGVVLQQGPPAALLADVAACERAGIRPPDLSRVFAALGLPAAPLDLAAAVQRLKGAGYGPPAHVPLDPLPPRRPDRIVIEGLSHCYADGHAALRDVALTVGHGEFVAVVGHNGSGKTTLAKHLIGLLRPTTGTVRFDGRAVDSLAPAELAQRIGYVFQDPDHQLFAATAWEEVAFGPQSVGLPAAEIDARVHAALAAVELEGLEHTDPFLLDKGSRQRLAVASVLSLRPDVLLLDEPTTGLDDREQDRMLALLRRLHATGQTIVIITHTPWVIAEYAERVVMLRGGMLAYDGSVRGFFADDALVRAASFEPPQITQLGRHFGCTPLTVDELLRWWGAGP
jgi:energy-coupling factor transport system ATP-binding protein